MSTAHPAYSVDDFGRRTRSARSKTYQKDLMQEPNYLPISLYRSEPGDDLYTKYEKAKWWKNITKQALKEFREENKRDCCSDIQFKGASAKSVEDARRLISIASDRKKYADSLVLAHGEPRRMLILQNGA